MKRLKWILIWCGCVVATAIILTLIVNLVCKPEMRTPVNLVLGMINGGCWQIFCSKRYHETLK